MRDRYGNLVATREFFPGTLTASVRQKTRWLHGIAFQGWDRLGWSGCGYDLWMRLRDRRGALVAVVLTAAYLLIVISPVVRFGEATGAITPLVPDPAVKVLLLFNFFSFIWRLGLRFGFTAHEYGIAEGLRALLRFPVGNIISIMAGRRALIAYLRVLLGGKVQWDHTVHLVHPVHMIGTDEGTGLARLARQ
jgi:bacteriophage N4 adsorption protein B